MDWLQANVKEERGVSIFWAEDAETERNVGF
jgi:hypothetical protein